MERVVITDTPEGPFDITVDRASLARDGVCTEENQYYVGSLIEAYVSLLSDSPLCASNGGKPRKVVYSFFKELTTTPIATTIKKYSRLFDLVASSASLSGSVPLTGEFIYDFRDTPVFREYHYYHRTGDTTVLRWLLTFLKFGKKSAYRDDSFDQVALRQWIGIEEHLRDLVLPPMQFLRGIVRDILPKLETHSWYPKFGPGAVSEPAVRGVIAKACNLGGHPRLDRVLSSPAFGLERPSLERIIPDLDRWDNRRMRSMEYSTLRFVPKDVTKSRSICMEPNSFMYFQQLLRGWMEKAIEDGPLRTHVVLKDQTVNQKSAIFGSTFGSVDTIDLSSASDCVSIQLVKQIFPREYLFYMLATRTSKVLKPDGSIVRVEKFAPMGSAVCFPTQCIIFSAVTLYAMMFHAGLVSTLNDEYPPGLVLKFLRDRVRYNHSANHTYGRRYEPFRVYGDDIICDTRVTDEVTNVLTSLGFFVNGDKSFTGSQAFRESCGVYAFNGTDVTPWTYKVSWHGSSLDPVGAISLMASANLAGDQGYQALQRCLLHQLLRTPITGWEWMVRGGRLNQFPFVNDRDQFGIFTKRDVVNSHLRTYWNTDYQRYEWKSLRPSILKKTRPTPLEEHALESYLYLQDIGARYRVVAPDLHWSAARYRPEETGLGWSWTPVE
jgi:hypothetical protein